MKKITILSMLLFALLSFTLISATYYGNPLDYSKKSTAERDKFKALIKLFPPKKLPFSITKETLQKNIFKDNQSQKNVNYLPSDMNNLLAERGFQAYSRMPIEEQYEPVAICNDGKKYAFIYKVYATFQNTNEYRVIVYTHDGKMISKNLFASNDFYYIGSGLLSKDFQLTTKLYEIKWENDLMDVDIDKNKISALVFKNEDKVNLLDKNISPLHEGVIKMEEEILVEPEKINSKTTTTDRAK